MSTQSRGNGQRIFILVIVAVFFLTAVATTGIMIYDAARNKDGDTLTSQTDSTNNQETAIEPQEGKLEGSQLDGFTPVENVAELKVIDLKTGEGAEVTEASTVTAHYTGALAKTGVIFQSSKDGGQPFTSDLNSVIQGWKQGMPGMKAGGVRRIVIPAELAYGNNAVGNIPANSPLVFDIELIEVK